MFSNLSKGSGDLRSRLFNDVLPSVYFITFKASYIITDSFIFITFTADIATTVPITFVLDDPRWYIRRVEVKICIIIYTP